MNIIRYDGFYNLPQKQEYLQTIENENTRKTYGYTLKTVSIMETFYKKDITEFTFDELKKLCYSLNASSLGSVESKISHIRDYIYWAIRNGKTTLTNLYIDMPDFRGEKLLQYIDKHAMLNKYITREKLYELFDSNKIYNARDTVFLILPFEGILGKEYIDMRSLEKTQIDPDSNKIILKDGREIIIDPRSMKYIVHAMNQVSYFVSNGDPDKSAKFTEREILKTKYILEYADAAKIDGDSNNIVEKETIMSLYHKMKKIWKVKQYLSPTLLFDSGYIDFCEQIEKNKNSELMLSDYKVACKRYGLDTTLETVERYKKKYESYKTASASI
jgi:hypothetical protein